MIVLPKFLQKPLSCINVVAHGHARKISLLFVLLSFIGYIMFVAGFGALVKKLDLSFQAVRLLFLPYWGAVIFGPVTYAFSVLHIALSGRYRRLGHLIESFTTFSYLAYTITIASPFVVSALIIFGASGFGDFNRLIDDIIPLPSIQEVVGIDNDFLDLVIDLVELVYTLLQQGAEKVVDLVLSFPSGSEFNDAIRSQFVGCSITLLFITCSVASWPFYSTQADHQASRKNNGSERCDGELQKK